MLRTDGEFWPYAVTTGASGKRGSIIGKEFNSRIGKDIGNELNDLTDYLREKAEANEITESAIVTNRTRTEGDELVDIICVETETSSGFSARVIFDYVITAECDVKLGPPRLVRHEPRVFV